MKKALRLVIFTLLAGVTSCGPKSNSTSVSTLPSSISTSENPSISIGNSISNSLPDEETWETDLKEFMLTHVGEVIPYIELSETVAFSFDDYYQMAVIVDGSGYDFTEDYVAILEANGFIQNFESYSIEYYNTDIYIILMFDSWSNTFQIYIGTNPTLLSEWDGDLSQTMMDLYGVEIPVVFTDKATFSYDSELNELYIQDMYYPFLLSTDYFYTLIENGYTYIETGVFFEFLYIETPLHEDKVFVVGLSLYDASLVLGLIDKPEFSDDWSNEIISTIQYYFGVTLPTTELSSFTTVMLDTIADEIMILDPFTHDISSTYGSSLLANGYITNGVIDEYGLITYTKDDGYIFIGYLQGYGFAIIAGSYTIPPTITTYHSETVDLILEKYGFLIPVAPLTETYDFGIGTNNDVYLSDFRSGDITEEYVAILENNGYEFIRTESDGFDRYDGDELSVFIQYFDGTDIFEIWISVKPLPIDDWSDDAKETMLFRLGDIIPLAPLYSDQMTGFNATLGLVYIMDTSALDVTSEYDTILRANGYMPIDEEDLSIGYLNASNDIIISYAYHGAGAGMEIYAWLNTGPATIVDWDGFLKSTMSGILDDELLPVAPISSYYFGFENFDYETGNSYIQVFDYYCVDVTEAYSTIMLNTPDFVEITAAEGLPYLEENFPYEYEMVSTSSIDYKYFINDTILVVFGYDTDGTLLGVPSFVISAFLLNPESGDDDGGGTIIF